VVGEVAAITPPQSGVDARGRYTARTNMERMGDRAGQRMAHAHLPRRPPVRYHAQVSAAVDGAAPVALEPLRENVGRPSLDRATQVELQAGRPTDQARIVVDLDRAPSRGWVGPSRATLWRRRQGLRQRCGRNVRPRLAVTGITQRTQERRVDEAGAQGRGAQRGRDCGSEQWPSGDVRPRIGVQPAQVAARVETRQPTVDLGEKRPHVDLAVSIARDPRNRSHRVEVLVEHAACTGAVSRPLRQHLAAARSAAPCRRRTPAPGPRSARDLIASSSAASAAAVVVVVAGCAPFADDVRALPPRRPLPPRRLTNAPVKPVGATPSREVTELLSAN